MTDTGPLFVSSGDLIADRRYQWALDLAARGDLAGAADLLTQTTDLAPGFAAAWFTLGAVRDRLGDRDGAVFAFTRARDADPEDSQGAALQLARLGGGATVPPMSQAYVRRLFDQYAGRYDTALTEHLRYRGPAILLEAVERVMRDAGRAMHFRGMLDLGCGTGLAGTAFRPLADRLVGVDLSPAMIAKAEEKGIYDRTALPVLRTFLSRPLPPVSTTISFSPPTFLFMSTISPLSLPASPKSSRRAACWPSPPKLMPARREAFADAALCPR